MKYLIYAANYAGENTISFSHCKLDFWSGGPIYRQIYITYNAIIKISKKKIKGKAVPLQAWSGPEGSRKLRFPDFMTTALKGGKVVSLTHRPHLPSGNPPGTLFC